MLRFELMHVNYCEQNHLRPNHSRSLDPWLQPCLGLTWCDQRFHIHPVTSLRDIYFANLYGRATCHFNVKDSGPSWKLKEGGEG
eukprot:s3364_g6.t1